ncbi:hypothetical protein BS47DRAFT_1347503 [Hydnum rufescens UP504]|uniref:Kinetochore protein Spc24 n=1 Tax=Hydnum rufescens UP504 TaxID=1448309 RepID=A0A9P6ASB9_9AGAM|nr:hypothetical protein BS47DRAFT_1347503 [Hydnum rufescens UP504]
MDTRSESVVPDSEMVADPPAEPEADDSIPSTITVIKDMRTILQNRSAEDLEFIARTWNIVSKTTSQREAELARLDQEDQQRAKSLKKLRSDAKRPPGRPTAEEHAQKMAKLDKEKFDLYKEISEIEAHIDYSAGELAKFKEELAQLQARDVAAEVIIGGAALRLQMCKKLGFDLTSSGKVLVHSPTNAFVVSLDDGKSQFEKTNELWDLASDVPPMGKRSPL